MAPLATFVESRSVNCAYWSPSGDQLLSVTQSNFLRLFNKPFEQSGKALPVGGEPGAKVGVASVPHDNQTGRYLPVFHAAWDPKVGGRGGGTAHMGTHGWCLVRLVDWPNPPPTSPQCVGGSEAFVIGSMKQPRMVEVFTSPAKRAAGKPARAVCLRGEYLASVQSRNAFHPVHDIVVCGNASGRVHIFR